MCKRLDELGILAKCERFALDQIQSPSVMLLSFGSFQCRIDVFRLFTSLSRSDVLKERVFSILSDMLRDILSRYQSNLAVMKSVGVFQSLIMKADRVVGELHASKCGSLLVLD